MPPKLGEKTGVFSCRTPHRPNSIGISLVTVEAQTIEGLAISKLDIINGTPILQIRDHRAEDSLTDYIVPDWVTIMLKLPKVVSM